MLGRLLVLVVAALSLADVGSGMQVYLRSNYSTAVQHWEDFRMSSDHYAMYKLNVSGLTPDQVNATFNGYQDENWTATMDACDNIILQALRVYVNVKAARTWNAHAAAGLAAMARNGRPYGRSSSPFILPDADLTHSTTLPIATPTSFRAILRRTARPPTCDYNST